MARSIWLAHIVQFFWLVKHFRSKEMNVLSLYFPCVGGIFPAHKGLAILKKLYRYRPAHYIILLPFEASTFMYSYHGSSAAG